MADSTGEYQETRLPPIVRKLPEKKHIGTISRWSHHQQSEGSRFGDDLEIMEVMTGSWIVTSLGVKEQDLLHEVKRYHIEVVLELNCSIGVCLNH